MLTGHLVLRCHKGFLRVRILLSKCNGLHITDRLRLTSVDNKGGHIILVRQIQVHAASVRLDFRQDLSCLDGQHLAQIAASAALIIRKFIVLQFRPDIDLIGLVIFQHRIFLRSHINLPV